MSTKRIVSWYSKTSWDETPVTIADSSLKITRIEAGCNFTRGAMIGKGVFSYIMVYHPTSDGHSAGSYNGLMHFIGSVEGSEEGEMVILVKGKFDGKPIAELVIDEGTTTGGLKGLKGKGGYELVAKEVEYTLDLVTS